jgi:cell division protein FtsL
MLKAFTLPSSFVQSKNFSSIKIDSKISQAKILAGVLIVINAVLLISYIVGVNLRASTGFEIKSMQTKVNNLNQANKKLNLDIAEKSSVANLELELNNQGFVPVKTAIFLQESSNYTMR